MENTSSSAQRLLFVGCYAAATQPGICMYHFDEATGTLTARGSFVGLANPTFLVVHPSRRWLYAVSETSKPQDGASGSVWAFRFEDDPLTLQPINHQPSEGDSPCHLQLDSTGKWLLVSNYGTGSVGVLPILPDGSLGEMTDRVQHRGSSVDPQRQEGPHAHSATWAPDNDFAVVADLGMDQLLIYKFASSTGKLSLHGQAHTPPGAGPRHTVFHPSGQRVYVANELDSTVGVYAYEASHGVLRERQIAGALPAGAPESFAADIHISPSGQRLYVSNRGHNSVAVFEVDSDGRLARLAVPACGGKWPRNFALAPSGRFMLVANQYSDEVSVLPVQVGTAELGPAGARAAVAQPACVQFVVGQRAA